MVGFHEAIEWVVLALEATAAATILVGGVAALVSLARQRDLQAARFRFTKALLFALDFTIGADVLKVALIRNLETVAVAGLVVAVRIALTLLVTWEISRERRARGRDETSARPPKGS